ncbi:hypothetical protein C2E23DRAFT_845829 [Lenzites betulinus]|nr:hypothetical protein C2E23DRAFT_845829 [Lenzites betulinus]
MALGSPRQPLARKSGPARGTLRGTCTAQSRRMCTTRFSLHPLPTLGPVFQILRRSGRPVRAAR